jgi:hypothetical protein
MIQSSSPNALNRSFSSSSVTSPAKALINNVRVAPVRTFSTNHTTISIILYHTIIPYHMPKGISGMIDDMSDNLREENIKKVDTWVAISIGSCLDARPHPHFNATPHITAGRN